MLKRLHSSSRWFRVPLDRAEGFTLVEIMVALLIFGIGLVALAQVLPRGMEVRDRGRRMTVASQLARQQVETMRGLPFDHADMNDGDHVDPRVILNNSYRRRWTVTDDTPLPGMKRIEVRVSFTTSESDSEAVIVTQITR